MKVILSLRVPMRYDILITGAIIIAGIAAISAWQATPMQNDSDPKRRVINLFFRTKRQIDALREERRRIVAEHARKADAIKAAKVKRDLESL